VDRKTKGVFINKLALMLRVIPETSEIIK